MECLDIVPGILQIAQGTSRPGSCHIWLGSGKLQLNQDTAGLAPTTGLNGSRIQKLKRVE
jgi:hypothetical protein